MATVAVSVPGYDAVVVPVWVVDFPSFVRWVQSGEMPEKPAVHFINGRVWVDFHMEELNSHNQVKAAISAVLWYMVGAERIGEYIPDGMRLTNEQTELSCEPDGTFILYCSLETNRTSFRSSVAGTEVVGYPRPGDRDRQPEF